MEGKSSSLEKSTIQSLGNRLNIYVNGVFSFLATLGTLIILLSPFFFTGIWPATFTSFILGIILASRNGEKKAAGNC
jgi:hypothetical protein